MLIGYDELVASIERLRPSILILGLTEFACRPGPRLAASFQSRFSAANRSRQ